MQQFTSTALFPNQHSTLNIKSQTKHDGFTKHATLSPYLVTFQKRKKTQSVLREQRMRSRNQSSSKSFRIKEKSTTSLREKHGNAKYIIQLVNKAKNNSYNLHNAHAGLGNERSSSSPYQRLNCHKRKHQLRLKSKSKHKVDDIGIVHHAANTISNVRGINKSEIAANKDNNRNKNGTFRNKMYQKNANSDKTKHLSVTEHIDAVELRNRNLTSELYNNKLNNKNKQTIQLSMLDHSNYHNTSYRNSPQMKSIRKQIITIEDNNTQTTNLHWHKNKCTSKKQPQYLQKQTSLHISNQTKQFKNMYKVIQHKKPIKNKFRKNKYQSLYSSVTSNGVEYSKINQGNVNKSQSYLIELTKKQSNTSINKEMDILAEKQMLKFYQQMRSNEIQRNIEKSTEKYFTSDHSYRPLKSNNDIQIYVSTVRNPSINRKSDASTLHTSKKYNQIEKDMKEPNIGQTIDVYALQDDEIAVPKNQSINYLDYEFDFKYNESFTKNDHQGLFNNNLNIIEIENASEESGFQNFNLEQTSFERQRKQVEKQYFDKIAPKIEWSDEDCQIDELC